MYTFHLLWCCIRSFSDDIFFCERLSRPAPEHRGFFEDRNPHLVWNVALICIACSVDLQQQEAAFFSVDRTFSCSLLNAHSGLGTVVCSTALQQMFEYFQDPHNLYFSEEANKLCHRKMQLSAYVLSCYWAVL